MRAYIGLGSNLGDSAGIVRQALDRLRSLGTNFVNSDLYVTEPWGKKDQPSFINAVAAFDTDLTPQDLLEHLRAIEREFGRERAERWGPRSLDLDILLAGDEVIDEPDLIVPHPGLAQRAFVLEPLAEIAPGVRVPSLGLTARDLLDRLPPAERTGVIRLEGTAMLAPPQRIDYDAPGGPGELYARLRPFSPFDQRVFELVVDAIGPVAGKRVLDVGCGTGRFTHRLHDLGADVLGLDPSEKMLAVARGAARSTMNVDRSTSATCDPSTSATCDPSTSATCDRSTSVTFVRGDANEGLPAGPFDAITAFYCMQYIVFDAFARHARKALKSSGTLAIASFPHRHFAEIEFARYFPSLPAIDMARFPSAPAMESALGRAGFERIATKDFKLEIDDDPRELIRRVEQRYLSSFHLLPADEFHTGVERMRRDWRDRGRIHRKAWAIVVSADAP